MAAERALRRFRNYCGPRKIAKAGFPWEKTTKGDVASVYTNCETAVAAAPQGKDQTQSPRRDLVEFGVGYALVLAAIWTLNPWQRLFYWLAVAWIVVTTWIHRPTMERAGAWRYGPGSLAVGGGSCRDTRVLWRYTQPTGCTRSTLCMVPRR